MGARTTECIKSIFGRKLEFSKSGGEWGNERPFGEELEHGEVHGWRQGGLNREEYEEGATFYRQVGKKGSEYCWDWEETNFGVISGKKCEPLLFQRVKKWRQV